MPKSIKELQAEIRKLKAANMQKQKALNQRKNAIAKRQQEEAKRKRLEKELKDLQNPNSSRFKKNLKTSVRKGGRTFLNVLDSLVEAADEYDRPKRRPPQKRKPASKKRR